MNSSADHEEELLASTLALPAAERAAFLERECAGDAGLRRRVEALLRAHETVGDFLEAPPAAALSDLARAAAPQPPPEETVGTRIGRYKLLQKIGEGGCGVVYLAEQEEPIHRRVALKVIKLGMDTREVIARFETERQALALMDHPNIARVFDAGATDAGRPYFVMELVRGIKITDYCDQGNLPTAERLRLFTQVCHAIQHAHQKGIIHRDLKPSNILVTLQDGEPVPKVIDFGIAKAAQGRLTDQTFYTAFEQFIGTPAYMSPEQAQLSSQDVDTRSDIYSLGVLLYELLTGHTPFETRELLKAGLDEMRRRIREVEPPKPSTRLSAFDAPTLNATAQHRGTEPPKLISLVRGDLDWIAMRCLEKNRARRYETANALALDLEHHLHDEPVTARPPSRAYRLQKLVRRNKLAFAAASTIAAALVVGLGVSTWMFSREKAARERAVVAEQMQVRLREQADAERERALTAEAEQRGLRQDADSALQRAVAAEAEQGRQRQQAEQARDNEGKQRALAEEARASEEKQRTQAEADRKKAETEAAKSAQIAGFLSQMLKSVGPSVAQGRDTTLLREILDKTADRVGREFQDRPEVEIALEKVLGETYGELGDYEKSEALIQTAQTKLRAAGGAETLLMANLLSDLSVPKLRRGDTAGAEVLLRESLAMRRKLLGDENADVAVTLSSLGVVLETRGDLAGADAAQEEALAILRKVLGNEHPDVVVAFDILARTRARRGDLFGAEALANDALTTQRKLGGDASAIPLALITLADIRCQRGKQSDAEGLYREALADQRKVLGNDHPDVAVTLDKLGELFLRRGDLAMAETSFREALAIQRKRLGAQSPESAYTLNDLAAALYGHHDIAGAEASLRDALAIYRKALGNENLAVASNLASLAAMRLECGNLAGADAIYREALTVQRKLVGDDDPAVAGMRLAHGACLFKSGNWPGAEAEFLEAHRITTAVPSASPEVRDASVRALVGLYERWAKSDPTKAAVAAQWEKQWNEIEQAKAAKEATSRTNASQIKYANTKTADSAILRDYNGNLLKLFTDASVTIVRIDGALVGFGLRGLRDIYVSRGKRQLQVGVEGNHGTYVTCAKETVELEVESGKRYRLMATQVKDDFDLMLWDESQGNEKRTLLTTWRLTGNRDYLHFITHLRD